MRSQDCRESGFQTAGWPALVAMEPRIEAELEKIAVASGQSTGTVVKMTNCVVKWPVNSRGESISGLRTVIMDKFWLTGNGKHKNHGGIKAYYWMDIKDNGHTTTISREFRGMAICRGTRVCEELQIPFATKSQAKDSFEISTEPVAPSKGETPLNRF